MGTGSLLTVLTGVVTTIQLNEMSILEGQAAFVGCLKLVLMVVSVAGMAGAGSSNVFDDDYQLKK
ncbi:MAG: hypothetical protein RRC07_12640 [Anaerolineae bacterium]|nr:hypothetical protein [Anaerolineae bacterium]